MAWTLENYHDFYIVKVSDTISFQVTKLNGPSKAFNIFWKSSDGKKGHVRRIESEIDILSYLTSLVGKKLILSYSEDDIVFLQANFLE